VVKLERQCTVKLERQSAVKLERQCAVNLNAGQLSKWPGFKVS